MSQSQSLLRELESSLSQGTGAQRSEILQRVTSLFLTGAETYTDEHVGVFDDVMGRLVDRIEREALIELSGRLAPVVRAPANILRNLAQHDDIAVAGPVLEKSTILTDRFLIEVAKVKGQAHLSAIAGRAQLGEALTDVLVDRGEVEVTRKIAGNAGARFSASGMTKVATRARSDAQLAALFVRRPDVTPEIFDGLLQQATDAVKQRLMTQATPEMKERIAKTLEAVSRHVARAEAPRGGGASNARSGMVDSGRLKSQLAIAAKERKSAETAELLAMLGGVPAATVRNLVRQGADELLLILGRAGNLGWPEMQEVLFAIVPAKVESRADAKALFEAYIALSAESAQRVLRFIKMSKAVSRDDVKKLM